MKKKKLYIHIGTHKAGSTTIQETLEKESNRLAEEGIYYLGRFFGLSTIMREMTEYDGELVKKFRRDVEYQLAKSKTSDPHTYVISNEKFSGHKLFAYNNAPVIAKTLYDVFEPYNFTIKIIVYLRRQDKFIESMYAQKIKSGAWFSFEEFLAIVNDLTAYHWDKFVNDYAGVFGKENIIVRSFDRKYLPEESSLMQDFGMIIESDYLKNLTQNTVVNRGYSRDVLEVARLANKHLEKEEIKALRKIFIQLNLPKDKDAFFSNEERIKLLANYDRSNQKVAREYLHDPNDTIFTKFEPKPEDTHTTYHGITLESMAVIFSKTLLILDQQLQDEIERSRKMLFSERVFRKMKKTLNTVSFFSNSK